MVFFSGFYLGGHIDPTREIHLNPIVIPCGPLGPQGHKTCHEIVIYGNLALVLIDFVKHWL